MHLLFNLSEDIVDGIGQAQRGLDILILSGRSQVESDEARFVLIHRQAQFAAEQLDRFKRVGNS